MVRPKTNAILEKQVKAAFTVYWKKYIVIFHHTDLVWNQILFPLVLDILLYGLLVIPYRVDTISSIVPSSALTVSIVLLINHENGLFITVRDVSREKNGNFSRAWGHYFSISETWSAITTGKKMRFNIDNSIFNLQTLGGDERLPFFIVLKIANEH